MVLDVLVPPWCCHEVFGSHLLIGVPPPKVTVLQYWYSVTDELLEKCRFRSACHILILLSEHTREHNTVQRIIVASVKPQALFKLDLRRRSDYILGQMFIAMVRADKNITREPLPGSLFVKCQSLSCRCMDMLYISVLGSVVTSPSFLYVSEPSACLWSCCQAKSRKGHCLARNVCGALSWTKEQTQWLVERWSLRYMSPPRTTPAKFIC